MLFDTDVLSMLSKVGRIDLLRRTFPEVVFSITFEVYTELLNAREAGYDFIDDILEQGFKVLHLDSELILMYERKRAELKDLHAGEVTSILLCKRAGMAFVTNDRRAKRYCEEISVEWLDIVDLLRLCYRKQVLDKQELEQVIDAIEAKDRTRILRREEIFA
jgi:predicted nucleic acid-binding protein